MAVGTTIYKCSCGSYHPWNFDGDCTDADNRYSSPEEYAEENDLDPDDIEVRAIDVDDDEVLDGDDDDLAGGDDGDDDDEDEDEDEDDDEDGIDEDDEEDDEEDDLDESEDEEEE